MKIYRMMISISVFLMLMVISAGTRATDLEALSAEGEAAAAASASVKATPQMIMDKVDRACGLLSKEGKSAFMKFKGKDSEFIFAGTYIWIHDMKGVMQMHPIKHKMEGKELIGLKDVNGKRFFVEMNNVAKEKGSGWVDYMWPKPGEKSPSLKVSYIKKCVADGTELILGCGVYDMSMAEIEKAMQ
ncbi:MAG: hypothetical protein C4522_08200 [Desulfobacteraceae bacterium]|nr:MAG: hypothetical protein C4522_08200 [Desulfobacteraceae bacterium]